MSQAPSPLPAETPGPTPSTLTTGPVFSQRYAALGGYTGSLPGAPLHKVKGALIGRTNVGKSHLIQSCPNSYILNADAASTVVNPIAAQIWPAKDSQGRLLGDNGAPITLKWSHLQEKRRILLDLAARNQPRPDTIFLDSFSAAISLAREFVMEKRGATEWEAIGGDKRTAWEMVHQEIIGMMDSLHRAGYGFFYIMHVTNAKVEMGENRLVSQPELTITDGFWSKFQHALEFVGALRTDIESVTETVETPVTVRGVTHTERRPVTTRRKVWFLTVNDPEYSGICRARTKTPLPDKIYLPPVNPWAYLESIYSQHI